MPNPKQQTDGKYVNGVWKSNAELQKEAKHNRWWQIGTTAASIIPTAVKLFASIFNHPKWYEYHGKLRMPVFSSDRPFDPDNLKEVRGFLSGTTYHNNPSLAVGHVIHVNCTVDDFRNTDSWNLAMSEAFRINRLVLRSNLIYDEAQFSDYIFRCILVLLKAKQIERCLGWDRVTMGDIPELHDALSNVSSNSMEIGNVTPIPILMLRDEHIANTLVHYSRLQAIVKQLQIPGKLREYIDYYAGSMFVDQRAPNPNLYMNVIRDIPIYNTNAATGELEQVGTWNIETSNVIDVYNECNNILKTYGVLAADIAKTGAFDHLILSDINAYSPVMLKDVGYFNLLINAYTCNRSEIPSDLINEDRSDFIRLDTMEELAPENMVGLMNALTTYAGVPGILKIQSQAVFFNTSSSDAIPNIHYHEIVTSLTGSAFQVETGVTNGYFLQMRTLVSDLSEFKEHASGYSHTLTATASQRVSDFTVLTTYTGAAIFDNDRYSDPDRLQFSTLWKLGYYNAVLIYGIELVRLMNGKSYALVYYNGSKLLIKCNTSYFMSQNTEQTISFDSQVAVNFVHATVVQGSHAGTTYVQYVHDNTSSLAYLEVASATDLPIYLTMVKEMAGESSPTPAFIEGSLKIELNGTVTNITYEITQINAGLASLFTEQVDYHIPLIVSRNLKIKSRTINCPSILLKETYIPVLADDLNVKDALYWMYLGLFSVFDKNTQTKDGSYRKRSKPNKNKSVTTEERQD